MKREFSAGGVVFNNQNQILLIKTESLRVEDRYYWGFPKGMINKGESSEQAALREVEEETGIRAEVIKKVDDSKYIYTRDQEKIFKMVTIYLMRYLLGELKPQADEVNDLGWFDPKEALERLSFPADKKMLEKALEIMKQ